MTGFGSAEDRVLRGRLRIEIRSVDLAFVARQPDVLTATNGASEQPVQWSDVQPIVERAARDVVAMREREGQALATELNSRLAALEAAAQTIEEQAPARLKAEHERLKQAVVELTAQTSVDEQRLALEIALLADRVDITEELVRFRSHVAAARAALRSDQAVG